MKIAALVLRVLIAFCGFLPKRMSALPIGALSALLDACKGGMIITGDSAGVRQIDSVGDEIDKDVLVSQAKRATAVFDKEL